MNDDTDVTILSNIISNTVASLIQICNANNLRVPRLNENFTLDSESFRFHKDTRNAVKVISAAALQLAATLMPPQETVFQITNGHLKSAALRVAVECHVPEILRDAGPKGLHTKAIAAKSGVDDLKLARLLRYLASRHIFREIAPDIFTHNRVSGVLDTGKSIDAIFQDPGSKHDGTTGFVALVELFASDCHKASAYLLENMKDPKTSHSTEVNQAAIQRGLRTDMSYWEWYSQPERLYECKRFGMATRGDVLMEPPNYIINAFDWKLLPANSVIVDVAGGVGGSSLAILKASPQLNMIVQDIPVVIEQAIRVWETEFPDALTSQQVKLQVHDMLSPQPVRNAAAFLLKNVIHDWPDIQSVQILTHLREAAMPTTRLILFDTIIPYTFDSKHDGIPGLSIVPANETPYSRDITMMVFANAQERTLAQFRELLARSGWRIVKSTCDGVGIDCIEALPA